MDVEVIRVFPTLIGQFRVPNADSMNQDLRSLILTETTRYGSLGRRNVGGWHSQTDYLEHPARGLGSRPGCNAS
jgi:hypothetical protein